MAYSGTTFILSYSAKFSSEVRMPNVEFFAKFLTAEDFPICRAPRNKMGLCLSLTFHFANSLSICLL